jgi:hypothetical protein
MIIEEGFKLEKGHDVTWFQSSFWVGTEEKETENKKQGEQGRRWWWLGLAFQSRDGDE